MVLAGRRASTAPELFSTDPTPLIQRLLVTDRLATRPACLPCRCAASRAQLQFKFRQAGEHSCLATHIDLPGATRAAPASEPSPGATALVAHQTRTGWARWSQRPVEWQRHRRPELSTRRM